MDTVSIAPYHRQLYQVQAQNSHPRLSVLRVLHVRFCRWLDKSSPEAILKMTKWGIGSLVLGFLVFLPEPTLDLLISLARWNGSRIPLFCLTILCLLKAKPMFRWFKRTSIAKRGANQHSFHGVPVGELASFLTTNESFKREDAIKALALSQGQYAKIADELEAQGVLTRGENNARVMRPIGLENLVTQLRDNFPLVWDEDHQCFVEKDGMYARYCLSKEFERKKLKEETARKERKLERLEQKIEAAKTHPLFTSLAA